MPNQVLEKLHHVFSAVGSVLHSQVQLPFRGNTTHGRKLVAAQGSPDDGILVHWGIGAYLTGQQVEAGLVGKDHRSPFLYRLFFVLGPTFSLPSPNGFFIPLGRSVYRFPAGPTTSFQVTTHMGGMVRDPEPVSNRGRHSGLGPNVDLVSLSLGSLGK